MTSERVIAKKIMNTLAKKHGDETWIADGFPAYKDAVKAMEQALLEAREKERERCAAIAKQYACPNTDVEDHWDCGDEIAERIRAQGDRNDDEEDAK